MYPVIFFVTHSDFPCLVQIAGGLTNFSSQQQAPMSIATLHRVTPPIHTPWKQFFWNEMARWHGQDLKACS